jgi:citrate lyase subunit alpha/citrate CoA-transferase
MTIITCPIARKVPIIIDKVTTISTPGDLVDVIVTDAGISVNPKRTDLIKMLKKAGIDIKDIYDLRDMAYSTSEPMKPDFTEEICTAVEYRDGTLLDVIYKVEV